jgi:hypothetical protein
LISIPQGGELFETKMQLLGKKITPFGSRQKVPFLERGLFLFEPGLRGDDAALKRPS